MKQSKAKYIPLLRQTRSFDGGRSEGTAAAVDLMTTSSKYKEPLLPLQSSSSNGRMRGGPREGGGNQKVSCRELQCTERVKKLARGCVSLIS